MLEAFTAADLDCIRYCGKNQRILSRLQEEGLIKQADIVPKLFKLRTWLIGVWSRLGRADRNK